MLEGIPLTRGWTDHDLTSLYEVMQITLKPFDSQPRGEVVSPNEDYIYESRKQHTHNLAVSIFCWICSSALHPAPHKFRHHSRVNVVVLPQLAPKCSPILTERLTR